jgi:hypothetical protein
LQIELISASKQKKKATLGYSSSKRTNFLEEQQHSNEKYIVVVLLLIKFLASLKRILLFRLTMEKAKLMAALVCGFITGQKARLKKKSNAESALVFLS